MSRNPVHDPFDNQHALRRTKASERIGADCVGFPVVAGRLEVFQKIAIVRVKHGPVHHRFGLVHRTAALAVDFKLDAFNPSTVVETNAEIGKKGVTFAGRQHVVVTIQPQLDALAGFFGRHRCDGRDLGRRGFLAAKSTAQTADFDRDGVGRLDQDPRYDALHGAGVLRCAVKKNFAIFFGHGHGNMTFQIEMLLTAIADAPRQTVRRGFDEPGAVAASQSAGRSVETVGSLCCIHRQNRRQVFVFYLDESQRIARLSARFGRDGKQDLAGIFN